MTLGQALALVRKNGVMLESARGPVPNIVDTVVGGTRRGSWWTHPRAREVFTLTRSLRERQHHLRPSPFVGPPRQDCERAAEGTHRARPGSAHLIGCSSAGYRALSGLGSGGCRQAGYVIVEGRSTGDAG